MTEQPPNAHRPLMRTISLWYAVGGWMPCPPKPYRFEIMMTLRSSTNPWYEVDCIEPLDGLPEMPRSQKKGQVYRRLKINGMLDVLRETLEREVGYPVKSMRAHVLGKKVA